MNNNIILEIKDLSISYKNKNVLKEINLKIEKEKVYSIIGPNGCGKTTLMRTISRGIKPKQGKVLLYGNNIFNMKNKHVAKKMSILNQANDTISDVNVRKLVQYGRYAHKDWWKGIDDNDDKIVEWAMEKTGVTSLQNRRIDTLSGGEKQRAWIAMSIAQKPEILLLDEPTTYLDICHQLEIMELISRLNKEEGITIVMVLHDINHAARYSDELVVINNKKIHSQGDPWTILESKVLEEVFKIESEITKDKDTDKPIFYAKKVVSNS
ncbi:ABC transporter ATP-binding protein [Tissierella pigra]|uniref:ABC transporter ATP-binding protein n=1 Tax=Tissierella pigra TaxID=2607614 RepID=A0A6N7XY94_9FIRM|nr:ABC transporter ATP-binding protein [Tissierella pigra]MBU5428261.1 ABC transporter ATP-binding protein [Tissierella pigra]MSU02423.1 ABC transporter ATP-binding protein [Tissierella pigra]